MHGTRSVPHGFCGNWWSDILSTHLNSIDEDNYLPRHSFTTSYIEDQVIAKHQPNNIGGGILIFWLFRVRFTNASKKYSMPGSGNIASSET
jgi:hypothetical protein